MRAPGFAEGELEDAREAPSHARALAENGASTTGTVNRVYYAWFHAARAVPSERRSLPEDEDRVPAQFVEDVVVDGETSMKDVESLAQMRAPRKKADFQHESVDVDAEIVRAERFIDEMAESC